MKQLTRRQISDFATMAIAEQANARLARQKLAEKREAEKKPADANSIRRQCEEMTTSGQVAGSGTD